MRLRWTYGLASAAVLGFSVSALAFCPCHSKGSGLTKAGKETPSGKTVQNDNAQTKPSSVVTVSDKATPAAKKGGCGGCSHAAAKGSYKKYEAARSAALVAADKSGASNKTANPASKGGCGKCSHASNEDCPNCRKASTVSAGDSATNGKVQAILASLPSMGYRVGSETVGCPMAAKAMAEKAGAAIQYAVGDKVFDKKGDAIVALTSMLEDRLSEMKTVQYSVNGKCGKCPVTAKRLAKASHAKVAYRVAGLETFDKTKADEAAKLVQKALADVEISYKVGDASFGCDKMAGAKAKEAGKPVVFVVGSEQTPCETTAKMLLAQTKVRVAVEAAAGLLIAGSMG